MATVKTAIILDTRRAKKDGTYPVKLRVTFERKQQYYTTPHDLTKNDFKRAIYGERQTKAEKILKGKIEDFENKAPEIKMTAIKGEKNIPDTKTTVKKSVKNKSYPLIHQVEIFLNA